MKEVIQVKRACKVSLRFATVKKRRIVASLLQAYRVAVNFYIESLWKTRGRLDAETLSRLSSDHTRLSERYKSQALKQALSIVVSTWKSCKVTHRRSAIPVFNGAVILDAKFIGIVIDEGSESFDIFVRLSTLNKGKRITIPTKRTAVLNKWLSKCGAKLIQGCALSEDGIVLWVDIPDRKERQTGRQLGLDVGVNKLVTTSDGKMYGHDFKMIRDKINRRRPSSKGRRRAFRQRDQFVNETLNRLSWKRLRLLVVEDLRGLKHGKKKGRGKGFRKAMAPWTYRQVLTRIEQKCQENGVRLEHVDPRNTSRTCPKCGTVSKKNRKNEDFLCIVCGYASDADIVGARNILLRFLTSVESVRFKKVV